eukprot:gnl/Dysnectes_brevis/4226_a5592_545.p1 GENE.gnl/Dysnectes_brevis/4226_a5592_545~~gnl/Dysnectes_brevis/4226_a5592_545.p1  ORF type:complete len:480 (+),score=116.70 gnl/Dysnectes_brevis/4226_a5592_545:157-1596(+)
MSTATTTRPSILPCPFKASDFDSSTSLQDAKRPLTSHEVIHTKAGTVIYQVGLLQQPINLKRLHEVYSALFRKYPFLSATTRFDTGKKWFFYEPVEKAYTPKAIPTTPCTVTTPQELDAAARNIARTVHLPSTPQMAAGILNLSIQELSGAIASALVLAIPHAFGDGSGMLQLWKDMAEWYTDPEFTLSDISAGQRTPFRPVMACPALPPMRRPVHAPLSRPKTRTMESPALDKSLPSSRVTLHPEGWIPRVSGVPVTVGLATASMVVNAAYLLATGQAEADTGANVATITQVRAHKAMTSGGCTVNTHQVVGSVTAAIPLRATIKPADTVAGIAAGLSTQRRRMEGVIAAGHGWPLIAARDVSPIPLKGGMALPLTTACTNMGRMPHLKPFRLALGGTVIRAPAPGSHATPTRSPLIGVGAVHTAPGLGTFVTLSGNPSQLGDHVEVIWDAWEWVVEHLNDLNVKVSDVVGFMRSRIN